MRSTSIVRWSYDGYWKGCCTIAYCITPACWYSKLFYIALYGTAESCRINLYRAWQRYWICIAIDGTAAPLQLNVYCAWRYYWICILLDGSLQFLWRPCSALSYHSKLPIYIFLPIWWRIIICKARVGATIYCADLSIYKALVVVATYLADFYNL